MTTTMFYPQFDAYLYNLQGVFSPRFALNESSAAGNLVKGFLKTAEKNPQLIQDDELAAAKNVLKKLQNCRTADFTL